MRFTLELNSHDIIPHPRIALPAAANCRTKGTSFMFEFLNLLRAFWCVEPSSCSEDAFFASCDNRTSKSRRSCCTRYHGLLVPRLGTGVCSLCPLTSYPGTIWYRTERQLSHLYAPPRAVFSIARQPEAPQLNGYSLSPNNSMEK